MKLKQVFSHKKNEEELQVEIIKNSEFFDTKWYLDKNPDVKARKMSAARHYLKKGWLENRNPGPKFSTQKYLKKYPECKICPLVFEHNRNGYVDLAICVIMKNEGLYVKEWIDYHLLVGVKRFYIYDNESTDNMKEILTPYIEKGIVVYKYYPGEAMQSVSYNECVKEYRNKVEWLAFIDADEFIVPKEKDTIPEFLKDYEEFPAVVINWVNFDSNHHKTRPQGGLLENYTRTYYNLDIQSPHRIKSIVRPKMVQRVMSVHFAKCNDKKFGVTENKEENGWKVIQSGPSFTNFVSTKKIQINHYYSKSEEEYRAKIERGRATQKKEVKKKFNANHVLFGDCRYDYSIYKYLIKLKPELKLRETIRYYWLKLKNIGLELYHPFNKKSIYRYFDAKWYFKQYPDAKKSKLSAVDHYNMYGWLKGYNPSPNFNTNDYLKEHPDIVKLGFNPLCHFLSYSGKLPAKSEAETVDKKGDVWNTNDIVDLSICAIMKDEAPYVKEWLDYHLLVGVKRFYIYDNESTDNMKEILTPYIEKGIVVYQYFPGKNQQLPAYNDCLKKYGNKTHWLAFIDIDEFIVPKEKNTIPEFLKDYEKFPGVVINWVNYDSNNHQNKPQGGVIENYTRTYYNLDIQSPHRVKSIVKPAMVKEIVSAHFAKYKDEKCGVTENKEENGWKVAKAGPSFTNFVSTKKIQINHYFSRSVEEYRTKCDKGRVNYGPLNRGKLIFNSKLAVFDDYKYDYSIYKHLIKLKPKLKLRETLKYYWLKLKNIGLELYHPFNKKSVYHYFDGKWYFEQYPEARASHLSAIKHYNIYGWLKGYNPSPNFNTNDYLREHPNVTKTGFNPLCHFLSYCGKLPAKSEEQRKYSVTVITPTYNRLQYLEKAINMLKAQTLKDIKFIIVDDGSSDGSVAYIEKAIKDDDRFLLLKNDRNYGPSAARNKAFPLVDSDYIGFFDVDDEIPANYFEQLYQSAVKSKADIVFANYNQFEHRIKRIVREADKYKVLRNGAIWDKLYKTSLLEDNKIRFTEKLYTADNLFNIEAFQAAKKIVLVDEPRYHYVLHNDSIGKDENLIAKRKEDIITICKKAVKFAKEKKLSPEARMALQGFLRFSYSCYQDDKAFCKKLDKYLWERNKHKAFHAVKPYNKNEYDLVAQSGYFDAKYYRRHNPLLWFSKKDLLEDYLSIGWLKGKNPSTAFDGNKYLRDYPDVDRAGLNPLVHYLRHGIKERRVSNSVTNVPEKVLYALKYPIRVKEEYDRLTAEIKALENMK